MQGGASEVHVGGQSHDMRKSIKYVGRFVVTWYTSTDCFIASLVKSDTTSIKLLVSTYKKHVTKHYGYRGPQDTISCLSSERGEN